jgi:hypothetical protein
MSSNFERKPLIVSFSELSHDEDDHRLQREYATMDDAFLNQNIISYSLDEVHAMMQLMCCNIRPIANCYNPFYLVIFVFLFIVVLPGAALHWSLLCCISVRKKESPEERELRSQGIYAALGISVISIPFAAIGLYIGTDEMIMVNKVSLYVNLSIIVTSLLGLKALGDELVYTIRVFAVGSWVIDLFLIGLCLVDVYSYMTFSWLTTVSYVLRFLGILIYSIVALQCLSLWGTYESKKESYNVDILYSSILMIIYTGVAIGFIMIIVESEENAYRVIYF